MDFDGPSTSSSRHNEQEVTKLWRVWRTMTEMLYDRGYEISKNELEISREEFRTRFQDENGVIDRRRMTFKAVPTEEMVKRDTPRLTKSNPTPTTSAGTVWVEFCPEDPVGTKATRAFAHNLSEHNYSVGILIARTLPKAIALRAFEPLLEANIRAECFAEEDLLINITKHELVPKHILLSDEEKKVLLDRYRLKETQLPRIQSQDPVAKYLGLKRGQVVKIIRKSETAGRYASYRWVYQ